MSKLDARKAILEAAERNLRPMQVMRLRVAMLLRPFATQNACDLVMMQCQAEGLVTEDGEVMEMVDWDSILRIVELLLPLILKLFGL